MKLKQTLCWSAYPSSADEIKSKKKANRLCWIKCCFISSGMIKVEGILLIMDLYTDHLNSILVITLLFIITTFSCIDALTRQKKNRVTLYFLCLCA